MSHMSNQTQDLYSIELVQDLDHEAAATVSGGALYLWDKAKGGDVEVLTGADPNLEEEPQGGDIDNEASYYAITGNKGWNLYYGKGYKGGGKYLKPTGGKKVPLPAAINNKGSSAKPA